METLPRHRCAERECPYFGQPTNGGCLCHKTTEQMLVKQRDDLLEVAEFVVAECGWKGDAPDLPTDTYQCEHCGERHLDWSLIPHDATCIVSRARAAIAAAVPGTSHEGQNIAPFRQNSALNESETDGRS